jgi:hypothetical protein
MTLRVGEIDGSTETPPHSSMASAIERAMTQLVPLGADENPIGRRKLALAIARGVLQHLQSHAGSLHVKVPNTGGGVGTHQQSPTIDVDLGAWP